MEREKQQLDWRASWIWCEGPPRPRNFYLYARKSVEIPSKVKSARIKCTGDSRYKLFVNGRFIGRGPARSDPRWQQYDIYDLTKYLRPGTNVLAALIHHLGEGTFSYIPGRGGFLLEGDVLCVDGRRIALDTDGFWRVKRARAWDENSPRLSIQLGFTEIYDAREELDGWTDVGFDDSDWDRPTIIGRPPMDPWKRLLPRDIPALREIDVSPMIVLDAGECLPPETPSSYIAEQMSLERKIPLETGVVENAEALLKKGPKSTIIRTSGNSVYITLDFGKEVVGFPRISLDGVAGGVADLGYSEVLRDGAVDPYRNKVAHADRYIMKDGPQEWKLFDKRGFRYMQLTFRDCPRPVKLNWVGLNFSTYPVEYRGFFECSDDLLNRIWEVGRYTVQLCMEDAYVDCPWRERGQWWGDAKVQALVNYYAFGDMKLIARGLRQIASSQRPDGMTMGVWPAVLDRALPDFCLIWITSLWDYYLYSGDGRLVRELYHNIRKALGWFEARLGEEGLLCDVPEWVFIDWADIDKRGQVTALNCFYYKALLDAAEMAELVGDKAPADRWRGAAEGVKNAINTHLWSKEKSIYVDCRSEGVQSDRVSQHANSLAVLFDIADRESHFRIFSHIFDEEKDLVRVETPYFMFYVLDALYHSGQEGRTLGIIRRRWGEMLNKGATTWWEKFDGKDSLCHGWSAGTTYLLSAKVLGVGPDEPGYRRIRIRPHPSGLSWAKGVVPSVRGDISVYWVKGEDDRSFQLKVNVPDRCNAQVGVPRLRMKMPAVSLNGETIWQNEKLRPNENVRTVIAGRDCIWFVVERPGKYEFEAEG